MDYFSLLHLQKEPFSNSPDPEMFFQSVQHQGCLQKLELAIRLKRGLSVVVGDIGTGKSTLCRQLIRVITRDNNQIVPYLILDPEFTTPLEFLVTISKTFALDCHETEQSEWQLKDIIKNHLLTQTVENQKILVLIIDEGQKLPGFCVELLREFLNFETNQHKLLQIVIFAQNEFASTLQQKPNFADRITAYQRLKPLSFAETRAMINFRLDKAHAKTGPTPRLFSLPAIVAIYVLTRGYPRRIVMLCSKVIIAILVRCDKKAGLLHVLRAAKETSMASPRRGGAITWRHVLAASAAIAIITLTVMVISDRDTTVPVAKMPPPQPQQAKIETVATVEPPVAPEVAEVPGPIEVPIATEAPITVIDTTQPQTQSPEHTTQPINPAPPSSLEQPTTLGTLEMEKGVSLSKMIARVYGRYSPPKLKLVLAANPQIPNPNQLSAQTPIHFPVLSKGHSPSVSPDQVYLELAQTPSLNAAYAILKDHPETAPPLLIVPSNHSGQGFIFNVIMEEPFADAQSALAKAHALPPQWQDLVTVKKGKELIP